MLRVADLIAALGKTHHELTSAERVAIDEQYWTAFLEAHPPPPPVLPPPVMSQAERRKMLDRGRWERTKLDRIFRQTWGNRA